MDGTFIFSLADSVADHASLFQRRIKRNDPDDRGASQASVVCALAISTFPTRPR